MRATFFDTLYEAAKADPRIILVNPDTGGYHCIAHTKNLPEQYVNIGIAEQNSIGFAAGLALEGKLPFVYNILAFATFRCYEQIRLDVCSMNLPVTVVGVGLGFDYSALGPSHQATEDVAVMRALPGLTILSPADDHMAAKMVDYCIQAPGPKYLRLDRQGTPLVYESSLPEMETGWHRLLTGREVVIVATGRMVPYAIKVAEKLRESSVEAGVIDLFKLKPFPEESLCEELSSCSCVASLEEHFVTGGIGTAILEALSSQGILLPVHRFGIDDAFCRVYGERHYLLKHHELDAESVAKKLLKRIRKN